MRVTYSDDAFDGCAELWRNWEGWTLQVDGTDYAVGHVGTDAEGWYTVDLWPWDDEAGEADVSGGPTVRRLDDITKVHVH